MKFIITIILVLYSVILVAQNPTPPVIDLVTVNNTTRLPLVKWKYTNTQNIDGYIVKRLIYSYPGVADNTYNPVAIINNPQTFMFEDNSTDYGDALPYIRNEQYRVIAFSNDGNIINYSIMSEPHKTIFAQVEFDYCSNTNIVSWTKYTGWGSNLVGYEVYVSQNNNNFVKIGYTNIDDTVFIHKLNISTSYKYFIRAIRSDNQFSESNVCEIRPIFPIFPKFILIDSLISSNDGIKLYFNIDNDSEINKYIIYRKADSSFDSIFTFSNISSSHLNFEDKNIIKHQQCEYFLGAINRCNAIVQTSDTISNIVLTGKTPEINSFINKLNWQTKNTKPKFDLYRAFEHNNFNFLVEISDSLYLDDIFEIYQSDFVNHSSKGMFSYFIYSINKNNYTIIKSNTENIYQTDRIFLPNTFNPNSNIYENRVFKPTIAFVDKYLLVIYNNSGKIVFETNNFDNGWNGKLNNGELAPQGTYVFYLQYTNSSGRQQKIKNYVNLVRR